MHRQPLISLLSVYRDKFPDEAECVDRMSGFARKYSDCFKRELTIGHLTGSAWLVDMQGERVLLTHHKKLDRWMQLGGHADGESDLLKVALKEAREESGITGIRAVVDDIFDIDIHRIPGRGDEAAHLHYDCRFLLQTTESDKYSVSDESHDLRWVDAGTISTLTSEESILRMTNKWRGALEP